MITSVHKRDWAHKLIAVALVVLSTLLLLDFPVLRNVLIVLYFLYAALLWVKPRAWMLVLPMTLPLLDLAPWSGRFLLDEFDVLVGLTLAVVLFHDESSTVAQKTRLNDAFWLVGGLLLSSYLISFSVGFLPFQTLDGNGWSSYYTNWNALRIGKGFVEGFALALLLARQRAINAELADAWLLRGLVAGVCVFGCVVLWERGLFADLAHAKNMYGALNGLLDFSTKYRITGLFSQMHLGGAAVDGYLVLCTVFPLVLLFKSSVWKEHGWAFLALTLALYAVLVTFTRGTYASVFFTGLIFLVLLYVKAAKHGVPGLLGWVLCLGLSLFALAILMAGFRRGGSVTLFAMSMAILGGGGYVLIKQYLPQNMRRAGFLAGGSLVVLVAIRGILTSKYTDVGVVEAVLVGAMGSAVLISASFGVFRMLSRDFSQRANVSALMALILALPVIVVGLANTRMEIRFAQVDQDIESRLEHWKDGFGLMPSSFAQQLFGIGLGGFPQAYLLGVNRERQPGSIWFDQENGRHYIKLGGGILRTGQRIGGQATGQITLRFKARRVSGPGVLAFRLCQRPLLVQEAWIPICANSGPVRLSNSPGWRDYRIELDFSKFKPLSWYQPHFLLFSFGNAKQNSIVDLTELDLVDQSGASLLSNGNFQGGGDRWMVFSDFEHLPWHAKNLYLHIYLEQGIWGLLVVAMTVICSLQIALRQSLQGDLLSMGVFAATMGFLALGMVATLFDVPRLVTLFYLLLLLPLIKDWQVIRRHRWHRKSSKRHPPEHGGKKLEHDSECT